MTEKLYDLDSGRIEFTAKVLSCEPYRDGYAVVLNKTCFFPEGGGQPSDIGVIEGIPVRHVREKDGTVFHECASPLEPGGTVTGKVDWEFRFRNMQTHSGEHILSGLALREFGARNVGFHIGKEFATVDFDRELTWEDRDRLELLCNQAIMENLPVTVSYPPSDQLDSLPLRKRPEVADLRVVAIGEIDFCGCCGTHVRQTGEIGVLAFVNAERYKGGTRISFLCGEDAFLRLRDSRAALKRIAESMSCKEPDAERRLEDLRKELSAVQASLAEKERDLDKITIDGLLREGNFLGPARWIFTSTPDQDARRLKDFASVASEWENVLCTAFSPDKDGIRYALSKSSGVEISLKAVCKELNAAFSGKGGGKESLCCGSLGRAVPPEELRKQIAKIAGTQP